MSLIKEHIKNNKKRIQLIAGGIVVTLTVSTLVWLGTRKNSYAVYVNDKVVATVKDKEEVQQAYETVVSKLKEELGVDIAVNETIEVEAIHSKASEIRSYDEAVTALNDAISYGVEAYEILVDNVSYAVVSNQEEATEVLRAIAKEHLPGEGELTLAEATVSEETTGKENNKAESDAIANQADGVTEDETSNHTNSDTSETTQVTTNKQPTEINGNTEVIEVEDALPQDEITTKISVDSIQVEDKKTEDDEESEGQKIKRTIQSFDFNEEVMVRNTYISQEKILTQEAAEEKLLENRYEVIDYKLKEGDNIWDIAMTYGTTMERILELNPSIEDETKMQIGDVIKVEQSLPILSITTVEEATFKELIPADIEYVEFSDLYKDETKVYQEGHDGLKELTVSVTKVNGEEASRMLISEKVLSEAKTKVIAYGTKEKPAPPVTNNTSNSSGSSNSGNTSGGSSSSNSGNNTSTGSHSNGSSSSNNGNSSNNSTSSMFIHPLRGAGSISSGYGSRWGSFHKGLDIAAPAGTPVYASAAGKVIYSGYNTGGYGKLVIIEHSSGYQTYYAHNSQLYVNVGETVSQGERIAGVGSTGDSTGNHVHFEVRKNGTPVNPSNYI